MNKLVNKNKATQNELEHHKKMIWSAIECNTNWLNNHWDVILELQQEQTGPMTSQPSNIPDATQMQMEKWLYRFSGEITELWKKIHV